MWILGYMPCEHAIQALQAKMQHVCKNETECDVWCSRCMQCCCKASLQYNTSLLRFNQQESYIPWVGAPKSEIYIGNFWTTRRWCSHVGTVIFFFTCIHNGWETGFRICVEDIESILSHFMQVFCITALFCTTVWWINICEILRTLKNLGTNSLSTSIFFCRMTCAHFSLIVWSGFGSCLFVKSHITIWMKQSCNGSKQRRTKPNVYIQTVFKKWSCRVPKWKRITTHPRLIAGWCLQCHSQSSRLRPPRSSLFWQLLCANCCWISVHSLWNAKNFWGSWHAEMNRRQRICTYARPCVTAMQGMKWNPYVHRICHARRLSILAL